MSLAKAQRRQGDGPKPVIPSEREGSKKDFSPVELRLIIPRGRNDKESFFSELGAFAPWREEYLVPPRPPRLRGA
jgi:hypothetical protein